ncbi:MAG: DNA-protecting protein DprA [Elusimicrobia bacterium]|nr:DNA-protecting protein DprA [Elusimicrobiota bacterium]
MTRRLVAKPDAEYPALLRALSGAPESLWVRGSLLPAAPAVAVVGSRRPTPYGRRMARVLAAGLARAGVVVVSGLARGIDAEAHEAALEAGGRTERGGAVLSELPPDAAPLRPHFPARNRIVSGLSWAVVVVEGDVKSGSLITARWAADQGREVLAVPGPADSPLSAGPIELLRSGARPAADASDILAILPGWARAGGVPDGEKILELLSPHALSLEELAEGTGWGLPRVLAALAELEAQGAVSALPGQHYGIDQRSQS